MLYDYFLDFHNQTYSTSAILCGFFGQKYLQSVLIQIIGLKISHRGTSAIASKNRNMQEAPSSNNILILLSIAWGEIEKEIVISCHVDDFDKKKIAIAATRDNHLMRGWFTNLK